MKQLFVIIFLFQINIVLSQFDDLYYDKIKDSKYLINHTDIPQDNNIDDSDNYNDYSYATRINRFHRNVVYTNYYSNFDNWYNDYTFDPFWNFGLSNWNYRYGINVFITSSWNNWRNPWNRYYNSWNNPWNNSWNNPWYYHNSWNNNNTFVNWNEPSYKTKNYESRKSGSTTSSVSGRNASSRRIFTDDTKKSNTNVSRRNSNINTDNSRNDYNISFGNSNRSNSNTSSRSSNSNSSSSRTSQRSGG